MKSDFLIGLAFILSIILLVVSLDWISRFFEKLVKKFWELFK